ncbi:MAG TPA: site-specific integrase [Anaerolineales bacterium]|nr:site-specific integrase [Anaerolineales bacterium]
MPDTPLDDLPLFSSATALASATSESAPRVRPDSGLSAVIVAWGEALAAAGRSPHTVKAFTADLRLLAERLGGGMSVEAIGTHDLKNFLEWMATRRRVPCSPKTYARRVTSLKAFFRWLQEGGVIQADPAAPVAQHTVLSPLQETLSGEEFEAVLERARGLRRGESPDARPYTLAHLLLHTGIKKGECLAIHLNHIELRGPDGPLLYVRYPDVRKRYKERKLSLEPAWVAALEEYRRQYDPSSLLFPWSPRRLEYLLEELGDLAGLGKHLSFDMCRWTFALREWRAGVEPDRIRQRLGLSKIQWREVGAKLEALAARMPA